MRDLNFIIDASKPAILVFPPTPLQKINTFTLEEDINKEVYFTLLNKSKVPIKINDYFVNCPAGFNCSLEEKLDGSGGKFYAGYTILPNQAMIISAIYSIKEDMVPVIASSTMEVKFTPENFKNCPLEGCVAKSSPLNFQVGLIDQQEFQINVSNQQEQKYCVDYEGRVGRTGKSYLPKINLYLGGNSPVSSLQSESNLISMDECSPVDLNGRENSNWVYCTQKEFLVQLAKRIDKYYTNLEAIESLESLARFDDARKRREENGLLSSFSVYLRAQDLDLDNRSNSISRLAQIENETILTNIGFKGEKITDINKLGSLISGITIKKLVKGVQVGSLEITPGEYKVVIDINRDEDNMGLFVEGRLNNQVKIVVSLEKKSEPKLNWFFYYQDNDLDNVDYATPTIESLYKNNYSERGMILSFEKKEGEVGNLEKFYSTYAVPLIVRLVGQNKEGDYISDSEFILKKVNHSYKKGDIFSIWSGFASSEGQGCTSTVKSEQGKGLPYRVLDTAIDELGRFEIKDLNHLKQGSVMYLSTVLYLPSSEEIQLEAPFNIYTSKEKIVGTPEAVGAITIKENTYGEHKISSIKELFSAFEEGKVCVLYDNSTGREKWELFWNQDKILDQLEDIKKSIKDAKRCESSELKAS